MKTCPNCKELNGENQTHCWKCNTFLGAADTYKKVCPKCGTIYSSKSETCERCGTRLSVYGQGQLYHDETDSASAWIYVVSFLIPLIGFIMGCVYISKEEPDMGKSLIITGAVSMAIWFILVLLLF